MLEDWVIEILNQCKKDDVAFFFKQWGGIRPKSGGRLLQGRQWDDYPRTGSRPPEATT
jgi:protein gp37